MNHLLKIRIMMSIVCLLFAASFIFKPIPAGPTEPETMDYAEFRYDPYLPGYKTITIYFRHDSQCNLYIRLYKFNTQVTSWTIDGYIRSGYRTYVATTTGRWRLECYMSGYMPYWTDETWDKFVIGTTNLGSDWARHPQDLNIYAKAASIIGTTSSSYEAAQLIKSHVLNHFQVASPGTFQRDVDMLNTLNTYGHYHGNCKGDAVILTAYARALGIPARIIEIDIHGTDPDVGDDKHFTAEFYIPESPETWVPVDGDPYYNWFGLSEANQALHRVYYPYGYVEAVGIINTITSVNVYSYVAYGGPNNYHT